MTGAAVKVEVLDDRDQIAAINAYQELNHTEVVTRDIYQVRGFHNLSLYC